MQHVGFEPTQENLCTQRLKQPTLRYILCRIFLVDAVRIERTFMLEACHGQAIYAHSYQLLHPNLVPRDRIELPIPDYKTGVMPFN